MFHFCNLLSIAVFDRTQTASPRKTSVRDAFLLTPKNILGSFPINVSDTPTEEYVVCFKLYQIKILPKGNCLVQKLFGPACLISLMCG